MTECDEDFHLEDLVKSPSEDLLQTLVAKSAFWYINDLL